MSELKPCPFCGGEPKVKTYYPDITLFVRGKSRIYIVCETCGARTRDFIESPFHSAYDEAIKVWNQRKEEIGGNTDHACHTVQAPEESTDPDGEV